MTLATNYYISATGNDAASGLTPSTPWSTIGKINHTSFSPGDSILFKRDDAWREGEALYGLSNGSAGHHIIFGAYGTGTKPLILASKDISASIFWINSYGNIWKTTSKINITRKDLNRTGQITPDVANLIFNNEESVGVKKRYLEDLTDQGYFCINLADTLLYLYSTVNPSEYYFKIEATGIRNCENNIEVINGHYITFNNLDIRYSKNNGLFLSSCSNIEIISCDFSYIGGCYYPIQTYMLDPNPNPVRMGNGVQLWKGNSYVTVRNCNINQIYDAGISPQGTGSAYSIRNLRFHHNYINNCFYSFEFWGRPSTSSGDSIFFENNTCMNVGSGWSTSQRPDKGGAAHLKFFSSDMGFSNVFIRNNIFDESVNYCLYSQQEYDGSNRDGMWAAFTLDYNCYYQSTILNQVIRWRGGAANGGGDYFMYNLVAYQAKSGKEYHTIFADPMLTSDYALQPDSPAIDAGIYVGYPYTGEAPNIGAFEFTIGDNKPPSISDQGFQIDKDVTNGTLVGTVIASDPDVNQILNFTILSGNTGNAFAIDPLTGVLTVANAGTLTSDFKLVVRVQDNGTEKINNRAIITIKVLPGKELPDNKIIIKIPNPVLFDLRIIVEGNEDIFKVEILNSLGLSVYRGTFSKETVVPSTFFSPGIYFIKLECGNFSELRKIVKL